MTIPDTTSPPTPTDQWRAAAPGLPELTTPAADTAERLLLLVHYCIDWNSWIGEPRHRQRYWDITLPGRVRAASYRAHTLYAWWSTISDALGVFPQHPDRRAELTMLLGADPAPVLAVLRDSLPALLIRVRYISESVASTRASTTKPSPS